MKPRLQTSACSVFALLVAALGACGKEPPAMVLYVADANRPPLDDFVAQLPPLPVSVTTSANPTTEVFAEGTVSVALVVDNAAMPDCAGCYLVDEQNAGYVVRGSDVLGLQYGLAQLLENFGIRFFHPEHSFVPSAPFGTPPTHDNFGHFMKPETQLRGLHLHTLHPIESYFAFWEPSDENLKAAQRIIDWEIKNRGNYVQWVALDDILAPSANNAPWRAHTRAIIDYAHRRGVQVGIGLQLFGFSNLQHGFDLVDDMAAPPAGQIRQRLHVLLDDLQFDNLSLSFGEFFNAAPQTFIDTTNLVYATLQELSPKTTMSATVHVGDSPDQKVDYMGEHIIYYFLIKYTNPAIVPWIHSVMYYDLFEDAGGAYHHQDFSAHREYLLSYLRGGKRVGYHPETAYWVAFDNSVPVYLPLYIRSRWLDLAQIRAATPGVPKLPDQFIFTSGWEWGYWQNDYATLRMSYTLPADYTTTINDMLAPLGSVGEELAKQVHALSEAQHQALIVQRLAPYFAGRDLSMDIGRMAGIISQPDRPMFREIVAGTPDARARLINDVLTPLASTANSLDAITHSMSDLTASAPEQSPWLDEIVDGAAIGAVRARYIHALYQAAAAFAEHSPTDSWLAQADALFENARTIVTRRHAHFHTSKREPLLNDIENATLYQWGYLKQADQLCYWDRERIDLRNVITGTKDALPSCLF